MLNFGLSSLGHLIHVDMLKELYRELDGKKACGIDKMTKIDYGKCLDENINKLIIRIRRGTYKPKPARITEIPKEDGSFRPLAISCFEDKLVQLAVNKILCKIYEPLFLPCSYGFRPGKSCHDALRKLNKATFRNWDGAIIEIDIQKCFNEIPHQEMMEFLQRKISDRRLLRLIEVLMKMPIIQGENVTINTRGCPQGGLCNNATKLKISILRRHFIFVLVTWLLHAWKCFRSSLNNTRFSSVGSIPHLYLNNFLKQYSKNEFVVF